MFCCFVNWCQTKLFWLAWLRMLLLYRIGNNYAPALMLSWDQTPAMLQFGTNDFSWSCPALHNQSSSSVDICKSWNNPVKYISNSLCRGASWNPGLASPLFPWGPLQRCHWVSPPPGSQVPYCYPIGASGLSGPKFPLVPIGPCRGVTGPLCLCMLSYLCLD